MARGGPRAGLLEDAASGLGSGLLGRVVGERRQSLLFFGHRVDGAGDDPRGEKVERLKGEDN